MNILITGGTGLVGVNLSQLLISEGHELRVLSRSFRPNKDGVKFYQWNLKERYIDSDALDDLDIIIHLAGAGIADRKWTNLRKKEIVDSRVLPLEILSENLIKIKSNLKAIISASAVGIYGFDTGDTLLKEESKKGMDFISDVVLKWESAVDSLGETFSCRVVKFRIGIVLDKNGGALPQLAWPVKLGIGSALGNGNQWLSWIHLEDLCRMFVYAVQEESIRGSYNAVAPFPLRNVEFTKLLGIVLKRPIWAPKVPAFVLKLILGQRAQLVLGGNYVSSKRIQNDGFQFKFDNLEEALLEIYNK